MNFWNLAILSLSLIAPVAFALFVSTRPRRTPGTEARAAIIFFGFSMFIAALGVARFNVPVKMEFLWPVNLEQSGHFEFSLQVFWSRFIWVFFAAALPLTHVIYDRSTDSPAGSRSVGLLFLTGASFFSTLAFLCENVLLSVLFLEISAFFLHAFGLQGARDSESMEKAVYFKRSCFIFLGLCALLLLGISRQLQPGSVMLLGAVFYLLSVMMSKHNPERWGELSIFLVQLGLALFLLERVMPEDAPGELWAPLSVMFAVASLGFAAASLLSPRAIGGSFWMILSFLGYLLYLRFSSLRPADLFWGAYEAIGLGAAFSISLMFRFSSRLSMFGRRVLAYALLAVFLGIVSGAFPSLEADALRTESEISIVRLALLGFLTFFVSVVASKGLAASAAEKSVRESEGGALLPPLAPAFLLLTLQIALLFKWSEINLEDIAGADFSRMFYDPRVLVTLAAVGAGLLAGGLLGSNNRFASWTKKHDLQMQNLFPEINRSIIQRALQILRAPELGIEWALRKLAEAGGSAAGGLENADRGLFGDRIFRALAEYGSSLSQFARYFHTGQLRAYLFLGVLFSLISSLLFLLEGR